MRHLGTLRGAGMLAHDGRELGRVTYEFDGYLMRKDEVVASGEIHMAAGPLGDAFGRNALTLRTDDGLNLSIYFSGKHLAAGSEVAHADVRLGLPPEKDWRR